MRRLWNAESVVRWPIETSVVAGQLLGDDAIDLRFARFVERRRRLVEKQPVGGRQQGAGDGEALLFAARQAHLPIVGLVELIAERAEPGRRQGARASPVR